jgi:DeoR/GlpR family transcriptional regulator of sugar metabolism
MSTVGDLGVGLLETAHINKGFFGARGLTSEHGLMDLNPDEVKVKRALAGACEHVYGVVDRTKWTRRALLAFVPPEHVTGIVTDTGAPEEAVAEWAARGVEVIQAEPLPAGEQSRRVPARGVGR